MIEKKFEIDLFDIPARPEFFEQINANEFVPKLFAPKKLPDSIKIDLTSQTISVPKVESAETEEDTLFHKNVRNLKIFKNLANFNAIFSFLVMIPFEWTSG